jgi:PAS domain S-box-containing protein
MYDFLTHLFDTSGFPPRWYCGDWTPGHGWLHIASDLGVWSAYVAIPCVLGYFVVCRKDIPFRSIFWLFVAFILACGATHLMEALIFWWPAYRLAGVIKLFTAIVSWGTVAALVPVVPKMLAMRSPDELEQEIAARNQAANALRRVNAKLEQQVEALRASEERFRLLVDNASEHAIFMLDPTGRIVSWNPGAERIKQYRDEEIIGQHFSRFYSAEDIQAGKPEMELQEAVAQGRYEEEGWRLRKDGSRFWASVVLAPVRDAAGNLRGFSKITRDMTERRQAEENARRLLQEEAARKAAQHYAQVIEAQREQLRVTLNSIGDGVITTDTDGRVTLLNPVAESLTGWTIEDAAGQPLTTVFHIVSEQTRQLVENPVVKVLATGHIVGLANHTVLIARDGTERPIDDSAAPIRNEQGETIGVVLVFRDVVDKRAAESALRTSERRFKAVFNQQFQFMAILAPDGTVMEANNTCFEATGFEREGVLGRPLWDTPWWDQLPAMQRWWKDRVHQVVQGSGPLTGEVNYSRADGAIRHADVVITGLKDDSERLMSLVIEGRDITERKQQEKALRASEERWRTLAEALPNLVWTDLPDGQCDWLSGQWGKYTGIPENELLGLGWLETVVHPDDREHTLACWRDACADQGDYDLEYRIRRHDGVYHWFRTRGVPIRDEQGRIAYWFGTCTDIEKYKRLEAALREADRRKNEFLATLAHELRNPLAPIRNGLEVLRLTDDRAARERTREMMERQVAQLVRLVDDLLDISRISRNRLELRKARITLASAVDSAVETARPLIESKGHALVVTLPPEPVYLDADLTRLAQVFGNLLNNSAKYTDPGGRIELIAEVDGCMVTVRVRDNGIGIPAEHQPRIFEIFSQVDHGIERSQGGLGIGLTLVQGLVEMHGGSVEIHSAGTGHGSEFVVRLPVSRSNRRGEQPSARLNRARSTRRRILVVDDNRDAAASLVMMLSLLGHDTRTAHDGLEAVELAEAFRPDVILLDIGLPKLNGYDVCQRIRQNTWGQGMIIIAATGWGQDEDRRRSHEAGFDHHMVKPVDPTALDQILATARPAMSQ